MSLDRHPVREAACVVAAVLLMSTPLNAATVTVCVGSVEVAPAASMTVPISLQNAQGLGSLQLDLKYDPTLIEPADPAVEAAATLAGVMLEFNVVEPGRLRIAMISGEPVQGDVEALFARFVATGPVDRSCPLALDNVRAWDHGRNLEMLVEAESGTLTIAKSGLALPTLGAFVAIAVVIVVSAVAVALLRRRRSVPVAATREDRKRRAEPTARRAVTHRRGESRPADRPVGR